MSYERDNIRRMAGYTWGEQPEDVDTVKLNTNENPYPPSPAVQRALASFDAAVLRTYPRPTADPLRQAGTPRDAVARTRELLEHGDRVKFAGERPDPARCRDAVEVVYRIVDATRPSDRRGAA